MNPRLWTALGFAVVGVTFDAIGAHALAMFDYGIATALVLKWSWMKS